eukprot:TRINITY_DN34229_c0_g1_i1.p1 TRINITY_DN34229_c0_g1~~TRINITY_DN34229_c0_g1_i1.p1  ORF type:complete len:295 (-),score=29.07 TRINITY_DN34229_c0_g1_i1:113-997(-)
MGQKHGTSASQCAADEYLEPPFHDAQLPEDLRKFLLDSLPADKQGLEQIGFESFVDYPSRPGHCYLEGYFHALPDFFGSLVPTSVHPRLFREFSRPPAPAALAAFCEAFRRANATCFEALERDLTKARSSSILASVLRRKAHFADLSVQIHWGDDVPSTDVMWHIDACNSLLHLAIGLQGQRALLTRHVQHGENTEVRWQREGAVYVSSPACFPHAVEYPATDWAGRVVAVQCRLHLTNDELSGFHGGVDADPKGMTAATIFKHLSATGCIRMPGLQEVQAVQRELEAELQIRG